MSQPVRAIVFDLDGTLIDSRRDIAAAANHALEVNGFPALPEDTIANYVGDGAAALLERAAGVGANDARFPALHQAFLDYYSAHPLVFTRFCEGAEAALAALAALPLALCTNKPRVTTELVLAGLGLGERFVLVVAGGDLPLSKPDPAPIRHIAARLGLEPESLVVVGDGAQDVSSGRAAGARTVGVRGGIQPLERLLAASPDVVIDSLVELPAVIAAFERDEPRAAPPIRV